jgi:hypothetical protein
VDALQGQTLFDQIDIVVRHDSHRIKLLLFVSLLFVALRKSSPFQINALN